MAQQTVSTKKDGTASIVCPNCRKGWDVSIQAFKGRHQIKAKCSCAAIFEVKLELREKYRKKTDLEGFYVPEFKGLAACKVRLDSTSSNPQSVKCRINNISTHGLGFTTIYQHNIEPGDTLGIVFTLDNSARTVVEKTIVVRNVQGNYIGCEFADGDKEDMDLGFYLL